MEVREESEDGLSAKIWEFSLPYSSNGIVLHAYTEGTRDTKRHKFKGRFWHSSDERTATLPRPTEIPAWVIDEAVAQLSVPVFIGWTNDKSKYAERAVMPAPYREGVR